MTDYKVLATEYDYAEIVRELRQDASTSRDLYLADAIEELSRRAEEGEVVAESWQKACKGLESRMPRWIPVTERLPDDRRDVQITVFWHDAWRTMYGYYDGAYWHLYAPMHTEVADVYVIGWMEKPTPMPLPQPPKEEHDA